MLKTRVEVRPYSSAIDYNKNRNRGRSGVRGFFYAIRGSDMTQTTQVYETAGGVEVTRSVEELALDAPLETVLEALNARRGALFASGYEYPGRYSRWDTGFVDFPRGFSGPRTPRRVGGGRGRAAR